MTPDPRITVGSVVLRVDELLTQMRFWCSALDYEPREPPDDGFVVLRPRHGRGGVNVSLSRKPSAAQEPPRLHLDLYTHDREAEVQRLVGLGAARWAEPNRPADADYVILADPEGNRFCVVATT